MCRDEKRLGNADLGFLIEKNKLAQFNIYYYFFSTRSSSKYTQDETIDSYEFGRGL